MKQKIIIIHSSEIIRNGIETILQTNLNYDFQKLSEPSDFSKTEDYSVLNTLFIIDAKYSEQEEYQLILKQLDLTNIIYICPKYDKAPNKTCLQTISLLSDADEIRSKVATRLNNSVPIDIPKCAKKSTLTKREQEILKLIASGYSNKQIAEDLFLSIHTVITHRKNITEKLHIKSIPGLTLFAVKNDIVNVTNIRL